MQHNAKMCDNVRQTGMCGTPARRAGAAARSAVLLCVLALAGCAGLGPPANVRPGELQNSFSSIEELAGAVLAMVEQNDREALLEHDLTEQEYRLIVWPQLPISRQESWQRRYDFVWNQHDVKSRAGLDTMLSRCGGKKFNLLSVGFADGVREYGTYRIHGDARLRVQDVDGQTREVNLFGSVLEKSNRYKIISYNIH